MIHTIQHTEIGWKNEGKKGSDTSTNKIKLKKKKLNKEEEEDNKF